MNLCLVNGQGHYLWSTVKTALYFHNQFWSAIYASTYMALYKIINELQEVEVKILDDCSYVSCCPQYCFSVAVCTYHTSMKLLKTVGTSKQQIATGKEWAVVKIFREAIKSKVSYLKRFEVTGQGKIKASQDFDRGHRSTYS